MQTSFCVPRLSPQTLWQSESLLKLGSGTSTVRCEAIRGITHTIDAHLQHVADLPVTSNEAVMLHSVTTEIQNLHGQLTQAAQQLREELTLITNVEGTACPPAKTKKGPTTGPRLESSPGPSPPLVDAETPADSRAVALGNISNETAPPQPEYTFSQSDTLDLIRKLPFEPIGRDLLEKYESNPDVGFAFVLQHIHNRAKSPRFCEEQQRKEMIKQRYPAVSEITTVDAEADK
uniref:Uncharacterized protein n=1 Tax=Caenorhabditis japonica TaxID=281687 RepID=A0A8R1EN34_CAEJA